MSHKKQVLITIDNNIYDVTKFIASHPGEGIHDMYLRNYHTKNGSEEFEQYHNSDEAHTWIATAQEKKYDPETGIYCIGPAYFKKRIPNYFRFYPTADQVDQAAQELLPNTFFMVPKESNLELVAKDTNSVVSFTFSHLLYFLSRDDHILMPNQIHKIELSCKNRKWQTEVTGFESPASITPENAVEAALVQRGFTAAAA